MPAVALDYAGWLARYPEFAQVSPVAAQAFWTEAGLYCDNTDASPVRDLGVRRLLLGMVAAHLAKLFAGANGEAPSPLVGRISSASEGSVSVSVDAGAGGGAMQAFFSQTKYGVSFWNATAQYRHGRYFPGPARPRVGRFGLDGTP